MKSGGLRRRLTIGRRVRRRPDETAVGIVSPSGKQSCAVRGDRKKSKTEKRKEKRDFAHAAMPDPL